MEDEENAGGWRDVVLIAPTVFDLCFGRSAFFLGDLIGARV